MLPVCDAATDVPVACETKTFIVANRLPVEFDANEGWRPSPGGLVSALEPALEGRRTVWVGWRGGATTEDKEGHLSGIPPQLPHSEVIEVPMTAQEVGDFYDGVCNSAFWPLYHDVDLEPVFRDDEFQVYRKINRRFADCVAMNAPLGSSVWVHDYHLQLVPALLRHARPDLKIGFFLHIPFPSVLHFDSMPWKESVLEGILGAELIGFQTALSAERFMEEACLRAQATREDSGLMLGESSGRRKVTVGVFPVGPACERFASLATAPAVKDAAARIRAEFDLPELVLLGVDRLDYTKGIDLRIRAVASVLSSDEFRQRQIQFIQVAMPTRSNLKAYQNLRSTVEDTLHSANQRLAAHGLRPIHYIHQALPTDQVVALFVAADLMLVTSLADGMNLVSKEYVACRVQGSGRLVLSLTTGAAAQLGDAWLVDAYDIEDLKRGIRDALRATPSEACERMERLRKVVFNSDAKFWADSFLDRLCSGK